jgi:hypothetical protein
MEVKFGSCFNEGAFGGGRSFRTQDSQVESQNEEVHIRGKEWDIHNQSPEDTYQTEGSVHRHS